MIELGELEAHHEDFSRKQARVVVVSVEGGELARQTKNDFPHLTVVADENRDLISKAGAVHKGAGHDGEDIAAPTTILIDRNGTVKWLFRPDRPIERLSAAQVLRAIDENLGKPRS
jgi:peroxiredoxin